MSRSNKYRILLRNFIVLTVAILYGIIVEHNLGGIWFGVIIVRMLKIGSISPPIGQNIFVMNAINSIPLGKIFRDVWPFLSADVAHVASIVAVPATYLLLPSLMTK